MLLRIFTTLVWFSFTSFALAQQHSVITKIGFISSSADSPGVAQFSRADGSEFPHCTAQPTSMWSDPGHRTPEGAQATMSVILAAKAIGSDVRVWYVVDPQGYCRFQIVDIL